MDEKRMYRVLGNVVIRALPAGGNTFLAGQRVALTEKQAERALGLGLIELVSGGVEESGGGELESEELGSGELPTGGLPWRGSARTVWLGESSETSPVEGGPAEEASVEITPGPGVVKKNDLDETAGGRGPSRRSKKGGHE